MAERIGENNLKKIDFLSKKLQNRIKLITFIYQFELFDEKISCEKIFQDNDLQNWEVNILNLIESKYDFLINVAKQFISKDWEWNRVLPLTRAIIIYGEYELLFNEPKIVINEMINICKLLSPNNDYKFVNKVLDLISKNVINKK
ncbi:transcription antitermination factor NusB [Metamycoplasma equirhinis]|uniref:Transcription antitermination factor NusB n=1 Tax=Metamycoplasma equirhinis TaxID=92402 RepID=A0ABZ0PAS6_9BACT|nr:transcription antitermination factor NusB [Metamycoplasma equirhinis]TPD98778.1 transcription antitermination protein NusB [Metamycoplasma equirhinis]WPB53755.1 transcription antitermination factor NusB [Metamycoplasma equirhinis]BDX52780.1 N utilization substance protein B [Metamycoplasma equirhinis]